MLKIQFLEFQCNYVTASLAAQTWAKKQLGRFQTRKARLVAQVAWYLQIAGPVPAATGRNETCHLQSVSPEERQAYYTRGANTML